MKDYPAYRKVYLDLKNKIKNQEYIIGDFIPSEPELCRLYHVSRTTIRHAVELLEKEGIIKIEQGRGTEVLDYTATQTLNYVLSFTEMMRAKGYDVSSKKTYIDKMIPSSKIAACLLIKPDQEVTRIQRIQIADGKPIAILTHYLLPGLAPGIMDDQDKIVSLYAYLEQKHGIIITDTDDIIHAKCADFTEAEMLNVPIGHALLVNHRVTYSGQKAIECVKMTVDAERYEFSVHLSSRILSNGLH